jgi:hypothetical protein
MRFDWYQATIHENPIVIVETLKTALAPDGQVKEGRGRHNYWQSFKILDKAGDKVAEVLAGGPNGDPNAVSSGHAAEPFSKVVRRAWPVHRVTRFDAAEDLIHQDAMTRLEGVCRALAAELKIKGRAVVPDDPKDGKTYYLGAPSSDTRVRLYDKTAETRLKLPPERHSEIPENWARLEIQVRPRNDFRELAAMSTPENAWGFSGWTAELAKRAFSLDIPRVTMQAGRETDHQRAYRFMLKQYGAVLKQMLDDLGSWDCVGLTIGADIRKLDREKR